MSNTLAQLNYIFFFFPGPKNCHQGLTLGASQCFQTFFSLWERSERFSPLHICLLMTDKRGGQEPCCESISATTSLPKTVLQMPSYVLPFANPTPIKGGKNSFSRQKCPEKCVDREWKSGANGIFPPIFRNKSSDGQKRVKNKTCLSIYLLYMQLVTTWCLSLVSSSKSKGPNQLTKKAEKAKNNL